MTTMKYKTSVMFCDENCNLLFIQDGGDGYTNEFFSYKDECWFVYENEYYKHLVNDNDFIVVVKCYYKENDNIYYHKPFKTEKSIFRKKLLDEFETDVNKIINMKN